MQRKPVALPRKPVSDRPVKRVALILCRTLRSVGHGAAQVPGIVAQAATDVRDAWAESARPNA